LFFALADNGSVVALADDLDESRQAPHRRFVDAHEPGAGERRLDVARVHHAGRLDPGGPLLGAVDLGGDVVALQRPADDLQVVEGLDPGHARCRIDIAAGRKPRFQSSR
jgi:hypothetical protein